ncbi:MAG: tetratricopeptide repeat protein, partial [Gemmatales bacterium]|nr:tetratricopeptide repeat protein [Gemmatales bacterium]MDW8386289.1 tetratricopeptide repeat protein [Gemmatales bacterium]
AALGLNLLQQKKHKEAEAILRECLIIREKTQPDAWTTSNTMSMLGEALLGQAESVSDEGEKTRLLAEAETLLLKGYEGMKARFDGTPETDNTRAAMQPRIIEALDRLIALYTALKKPDEVEKYQEVRRQFSGSEESKQ